jgi:hypothetical protein
MAYREHNITLNLTLPVLTKLGNFVCEFDCKISFSCSEDDRDAWDWEVTEIEIEDCPWYTGHTITKQSDPYLFDVLLRGIKRDDARIHERIVERIAEAA